MGICELWRILKLIRLVFMNLYNNSKNGFVLKSQKNKKSLKLICLKYFIASRKKILLTTEIYWESSTGLVSLETDELNWFPYNKRKHWHFKKINVLNDTLRINAHNFC